MQFKEFIQRVWEKVFPREEEEVELDLEGFQLLVPSKEREVGVKVGRDINLSEFLFRARVKSIDTIGLLDYKDHLRYNLKVLEQLPENSDLYFIHIPSSNKATLLFFPEGYDELVEDLSVVAIPLDDWKINDFLKELIRGEIEKSTDKSVSVEFNRGLSISHLYAEFGETALESVDRAIDKAVKIFSSVETDWDKYYRQRSKYYRELPQMLSEAPTIEFLNSLSPPNLAEFIENSLSFDFQQVLNKAFEKTAEEDLAREEAIRRKIDREISSPFDPSPL